MTFGIERYAIPISSNGDVTKSYHMDWLAKRRKAEEQKEKVLILLVTIGKPISGCR
jgi:hypothetical protein